MKTEKDSRHIRETAEWLLQNSGTVIQERTRIELLGQVEGYRQENVLELAEVQRWLNLLGSGPVHSSRDHAVENCLAKLAEYGFSAGIPALDEKALPYCSPEVCKTEYDYFILLPFLIRLGYGSHPVVRRWFEQRLAELLRTAGLSTYDIYMDAVDKEAVPASLRGKRLYRAMFTKEYPLPSCYDFYSLAYAYEVYPADRTKMDAVIAYLLDGHFQTTPGGYLWDAEKRQHFAAGRGYLATLPVMVSVPEWEAEPQIMGGGKRGVVYPDAPRLVLFMEAGALLPGVRKSPWFQHHLAHLKGFITTVGRYRFPREYLVEREGYYLYGGSHMGLAENRRRREWLEVESTFRVGRLLKLLSTE